jgi:hypothetical protein
MRNETKNTKRVSLETPLDPLFMEKAFLVVSETKKTFVQGPFERGL